MSTTNNTTRNESTIDKVKDALHLNKNHAKNTGTTGTTTVTYPTVAPTTEPIPGLQDSHIANPVEPVVDSGVGHYGDSRAHTRLGSGSSGSWAGPGVTGTNAAGTGYNGTANTGPYDVGTGYNDIGNTGTHNPNATNTYDPSGSAAYGSGNTGHTGTATGTTGYSSHQTGTHGAANGGISKGPASYTPGSGTTQNTAGPHNYDLLNKMDPRVDANQDRSRTIAGNKSYT